MSDLAAPIVVHSPSDDQCFLSFCALMRRLRHGFANDLEGTRTMASTVIEVFRSHDPVLHGHICRISYTCGLWAVRMLLLAMVREIPGQHVLWFWDLLWGAQDIIAAGAPSKPCVRLLPYVVAACIMKRRQRVLSFASECDLVQLCNRGLHVVGCEEEVLAAVGMADRTKLGRVRKLLESLQRRPDNPVSNGRTRDRGKKERLQNNTSNTAKYPLHEPRALAPIPLETPLPHFSIPFHRGPPHMSRGPQLASLPVSREWRTTSASNRSSCSSSAALTAPAVPALSTLP